MLIAEVKTIIECVPDVGLVAVIWIAICSCLWMLARQGRRRYHIDRR